VLILVQRPQHKSTPDPVAAPKNIKFRIIFIEVGDTKKGCTFSGHNLAPKRRKNYLALSGACTRVQNAFNPFGSIRKNSFCAKAERKRDMCDP